jgi:hypothetical protein
MAPVMALAQTATRRVTRITMALATALAWTATRITTDQCHPRRTTITTIPAATIKAGQDTKTATTNPKIGSIFEIEPICPQNPT